MSKIRNKIVVLGSLLTCVIILFAVTAEKNNKKTTDAAVESQSIIEQPNVTASTVEVSSDNYDIENREDESDYDGVDSIVVGQIDNQNREDTEIEIGDNSVDQSDMVVPKDIVNTNGENELDFEIELS